MPPKPKYRGLKNLEMTGGFRVSSPLDSPPEDILMTHVIDAHHSIDELGRVISDIFLRPVNTEAQSAFLPLYTMNLPTQQLNGQKYYTLVGTSFGYLDGKVLPIQAIPVNVAEVNPALLGCGLHAHYCNFVDTSRLTGPNAVWQ